MIVDPLKKNQGSESGLTTEAKQIETGVPGPWLSPANPDLKAFPGVPYGHCVLLRITMENSGKSVPAMPEFPTGCIG